MGNPIVHVEIPVNDLNKAAPSAALAPVQSVTVTVSRDFAVQPHYVDQAT